MLLTFQKPTLAPSSHILLAKEISQKTLVITQMRHDGSLDLGGVREVG